jgi:hypothetical protein
MITVHYEAPEYLNICSQTITVISSKDNYEIIVVDNKKI